ncbi:uncharacterized protein LOC128745446 [Sabethes cyaneus]|uniref:uncharacterized protein LOC128745446 n=1 Tax=Sabethes cyaneus TaxID=53552 RepID=UPI00237E98E6|nr:uncharacterized protein LOC128745446 [Sabethes cyaneus]
MPKKTCSLRTLQVRLRGLKTTFNNLYVFMEKFTPDTKQSELAVRLNKLDSLWDNINEAFNEIESHEESPDDPEAFVKDRIEFENRFYTLKSFLQDKIVPAQDSLSASAELNQSIRPTDSATPSNASHVRLPQITLPKFSGKLDEWLTFRDLYTSLIHWQVDLPAVEKFHYLRSQLEGEALAVIDTLPLTAANYTVAWELLTKRYTNSKFLRKRQVQALFELPTVKRESSAELHSLLDSFEKIVKSLDQVTPEKADYKDMLLIYVLSTRLDSSTRRSWEEHSSNRDMDTLKELTEFLQRRIQILESLPNKASEQKPDPVQSKLPKRITPIKSCNATFQSPVSSKCVACPESHLLYQCPQFLKMSVTERDAILRTNSLCRNCFRRGHQAKECASRFSCRQCRGKHHTLVCFKGKPSESKSNDKPEPISPSSESKGDSINSKSVNLATTSSVKCNTTTASTTGVLLLTAVVVLKDESGRKIHARALLDSAAECNLMSRRMRNMLQVKERRSSVEVVGIQGVASKVQGKITVLVQSRVTDYSQSMEIYVLPKISAHVSSAVIDTSNWNIPKGVQLADPNLFKGERIDLLLGAESFFEFFTSGCRIRLGENLPLLIDSVFGWVLTGRYSVNGSIQSVLCDAATHVSISSRLDDLLERFWKSEEVGLENNYSPQEAKCEDHFTRTTKRSASGRYEVSLPKNEEIIAELGSSRSIAERRYYQIERRLARDENLREQYCNFMREYQALGHMRLVSETTGEGNRCYLPHHPVVKEESTTTKLRVVFDASARTTSGFSLNDGLLAGPVIQNDLRAIILRSRTRQIMLVADIEKMFRQIDICPEDRCLQSILWRSNPHQPLATYELSTVTYGTKPAPFLATRTLIQLATDEAERFSLAAKAVKEDFYMDDAITGADDPTTAKELRIQLQELMQSGGFVLRKFASNCEAVLEDLPAENRSVYSTDGIHLDPNSTVKTLGLVWMPNTDVFRFKFRIQSITSDTVLTKKRILSEIASLFDPLGLIGAVITKAKIFMQSLWCLRDEDNKALAWDAKLPSNLENEWLSFHQQLPALNDLRIERLATLPNPISVQLHLFSDASEKAFGVCAYLRTEDARGEVKITLLSSKSKVAPLKTQSIPRLELCGALLATDLYTKIKTAIHFTGDTYFWVDSAIVLYWLRAPPATWTTFVSNRVSKIQIATENCHWAHVPGEQNPADLISRGIWPEEIINNQVWWKGPDWLQSTPDNWPKLLPPTSEGLTEERRRVACVAAAPEQPDFFTLLVSRLSNYTDLIRTTAYCLRFIHNMKANLGHRRSTDYLMTEELQQAEVLILCRVQREAFPSEVNALTRKEGVSRSSPLRWYNAFIANNGLLRVGGRISQSSQSEDMIHPIVLPSRHTVTKQLMRYYHHRLLHAGPQLMLSTIRLRYWPLGGRNLAREIYHQCVRCYRTKPRAVRQFMADLPVPRVTLTRPFATTGVDYFGPIYVRTGYRMRATKAYVSVFVCFSTKAVHLELVSDLSTSRFLQALRRFVSRRGVCGKIYSDNGTNFVGAKNQMAELLQRLKSKEHHEASARECAENGTAWQFIPPGGPHFGGLWEAAVRSAKVHLLRVLGDTVVSYEDMTTLLVQVEGCLNSRPLTPLSEDPGDLQALTPGHFLVGSALKALPEEDLSEVSEKGLRNQWEITQHRYQHFWNRWRQEYLTQLQARTKWWQPPVDVNVGSLVVIREDKIPPMQWRMGRITATHPGPDGIVRVVTLRTTNGVIKRPVSKICILPIPIIAETTVGDKDD